MTALTTNGGRLVLKGNALGVDSACCCTATSITGCSCSGSPITIPRYFTATLTLGTLVSASGTCTDADCQAIFTGSYVLDFIGSSSTLCSWGYQNGTNATGSRTIGFDWYCANQSLLGTAYTAQIGFKWCKLNQQCIGATDNLSGGYFGPLGDPALGANLSNLCSYTTGDTSTITHASTLNVVDFIEGPVNSCSFATTNARRYEWSMTLVPTW